MNPSRTPARLLSVAAVGVALTFGCLSAPASAVGPSPKPGAPGLQLDQLDRGLATAWGGNFKDIPLKKPADGVTPAGQAYTYNANDASVGDVDGDGEYEFIVKWK